MRAPTVRLYPLPLILASGEGDEEPEVVLTVDEIASMLGGIFAEQLPVATKQIDERRLRHPDVNTDALIQRVKRHATGELGRSSNQDESRP